MGMKIISSVAGPMIPLATLRAQCEIVAIDADSDLVESHPDDALLLAYLEAAIEAAEDFTGLSIALRTYEIGLDNYPWNSSWCSKGIAIPRAPLISIESFIALEGGSEGELDLGDDYTLDDYQVPPRLFPVGSWPTMTRSPNGLKIRFLAGYRTDDYFDSDYAGAQMLPAVIRQALLLMVRHFWDNRGDSVEKALSKIPNGFEDLLRPRRILLGMA